MKLIKKLSKRYILGIIILVCTLFLLIVYVPVLANSSLFNKEKKVNNLVGTLSIPKIKVEAVIESVGLTKVGAVGVPDGPTNAAWFNDSSIPGEKGNAVIDGHSGWKNGIPAVFDNLYKLKKGDKVYVKNDKGITVTFTVREIRRYGLNESVPSVFTAKDNNSHLVLITCSGNWDKSIKGHTERLVVYTDKVIK